MSEQKFADGAQVRLNVPRSPVMVVVKGFKRMGADALGHEYECSWFNEHGVRIRENFRECELVTWVPPAHMRYAGRIPARNV